MNSVMTLPATLQPHPAAEHFPMLSEPEFAELKADIAAQGLLQPIWLYEGQILDGRNRYRACIELGVEFETREYHGTSPVAATWSLNGQRRHLTNGQRAAVAVKMLPALQEEARKRQLAHLKQGDNTPVSPELDGRNTGGEPKVGRAIDEAAKIVGVSATNIAYAKAVHERDPETFKRLESGQINVGKAYETVRNKPLSTPSRSQPREQRFAEIRELASEGNRADQIAGRLRLTVDRVRQLAREAGITLPDAVIGKVHKLDARRIVEETVNSMEGCALGLQTIDMDLSGIGAGDAKQWAESMNNPLKLLTKLRKKLLEIAR